jgi:NMD protein affecting ribosome stability and mRNA decay
MSVADPCPRCGSTTCPIDPEHGICRDCVEILAYLERVPEPINFEDTEEYDDE